MSAESERPYDEISRVVDTRRFPGIARSACILAVVVIGGAACTKDAVIDQRVVTLYTLVDPPDAVTASSCAVPADAFAQYTGAGDFEPDPSSPPQSDHLLSEMSPILGELPASTKQLSLSVGTDNQWRGYGLLPASGDVALLLWAKGHECELKSSLDQHQGGTVTPYDDRRVLIAGGSNGAPSFIADLSNGSETQLGVSQEIDAPRTFATATPFSGGVIVAGGNIGNVPDGHAQLFDAQSGSFPGVSIALAVPRANHGATLLGNGNILLVGGGTSITSLYQSLEVIDPIARHATEAGLDLLKTARANPAVLRLANGEVLVAGGNDSSETPVESVEWFTNKASQNIAQANINIAPSHHQAFVALPGGGALAVISPDATGAAQTFVLTPDHLVQQAASIASVLPGSPVRLFAGANGAPLLWTGTNWFRWSPWSGAFVPFSEATSFDGTTLANGPSSDAVIASPDSGLALWLENTGVDAGKVLGLRFDSRGPYSTDVETLLSTGTQSIAPDRLITATPDAKGSVLTFDTSGLTLRNNAAVVLTDATFADFSLGLQTINGGEPQIFFRDDAGTEYTIGTDPKSSCAVVSADQWQVTRSGGTITVVSSTVGLGSISTISSITCGEQIASGRMTIGLRGQSNNANVSCTAHGLVVRRGN